MECREITNTTVQPTGKLSMTSLTNGCEAEATNTSQVELQTHPLATQMLVCQQRLSAFEHALMASVLKQYMRDTALGMGSLPLLQCLG